MSEVHYLYLLSEDDNDDLFYQGCLQKITGQPFEIIPLRIRKGGGIAAVRKSLPILLQQIQYSGALEQSRFLVALDNDRSPIHPHHPRPADFSQLPKADQKKACRYCELEQVAIAKLGTAREQWAIQGAIAVPVQMLEAWLLLITAPETYAHESDLPQFSEQSSSSAKQYHSSQNPPPQLKDLKRQERKRLNIGSDRAFCQYCVEQLEPGKLAERSPSFQLFLDEIAGWNHPAT